MIDCEECIHHKVCKLMPSDGCCHGYCSFYISTQLEAKTRKLSQENRDYSEGYAAGFKAALRPRAEWIYVQYDGNPEIGNYHCSNCRWIKPKDVEMDYCGNCGADMHKRKEIL